MQTILGSGGAIAIELAKELRAFTDDIRLVSRSPEKVHPSDKLVQADVTNNEQLKMAVRGSEIVYVTVGFDYDKKVWAQKWPSFISHLIEICKKEGCRLVFFDNVYMYDTQGLGNMTEKTTINPSSTKGKIRAEVDRLLHTEIKRGELDILIARCADFYGPSVEKNSLLMELVFKPLAAGKKASWFINDTYKHTFTYTKDAGKATALLGNTLSAYGQVWHLPTSDRAHTGKEWIKIIANHLDVEPRYRVVSKTIVGIMGVFSPPMRELREMLYQFEKDYIFNSTKFEKTFDFKPTPPEKAIAEIIKEDIM